MAKKFKMASETYIFLILLSKLQFSTDFKKLECIRSVFSLSNFCRFFFQKSQMADFTKMTSFLRKNRLFQKSPSHPILKFFQIHKKQSCSTKTQDIPKNLPKNIFQDSGYFQNGVCTFFSYGGRYFRFIELIFGLSHYFLTFNRSKINFGFLDHPNMGLSYNLGK
jgi:hypothetical protein